MASEQTLASIKRFSQLNKQNQTTTMKPGLLNGAMIGLTLGIGTWGVEVVRLLPLPMPWRLAPAISGMFLFLGLGLGVGWLTARFNKGGLTLMLWLVVTALMSIIAGHIPFEGRTLITWIVAPRFWGLPVYPYQGAGWAALVVAGFLNLVLLGVLALLQDYRLEQIQNEMNSKQQLSGRAWFHLLLPMPLIMAINLVTNATISQQVWQGPQLVHQAIQTGRTYQGDLFQLGLQDGLNYNAIVGVRDQMSDQYTLLLGEINPANNTTIIVAHFDNGAWINCRILAQHLNFCYDAAPPFISEVAAAIAGQPPADCAGCAFRDADNWREWLHERQAMLGDRPAITRLAQQGKYVFMHIQSSHSGDAIICRFSGLAPAHLEHCEEVE